MTIRPATHAGSWYSSDPMKLNSEIEKWLSQVPSSTDTGSLPVAGARIIIAPHAGYTYSGRAAAYAYAALSITPNTRRIFVLGPSHVLYLTKCALTSHTHYETPAGTLPIDTSTVAILRNTGKFDIMATETDEREHSLEMQLPYIYNLVSHIFKNPEHFPALVPILVGNTTASAERDYGRLLAPYLADSSNLFIISSDFCHWGLRFGYTYYLPEDTEESEGYELDILNPNPQNPQIFESISRLDRIAMDSIESGSHSAFLRTLKATGNTICGRHPVGIALAALETIKKDFKDDPMKSERIAQLGPGTLVDLNQTNNKSYQFRFLRYEKSSEVVEISDSSVSYASAFAVI